MSTSTVPSPTFGYLYPSTSLSGITCASSRWEVLKAFLASSDGALVSRLRELSTGLLFITSIPGQSSFGSDLLLQFGSAGILHAGLGRPRR